MENFNYLTPTRYVFGRGTEAQTGELVRANGGTAVLLHFGGGSVKKSGVYDRVLASLEAAGLRVVPLGGVKPNPRSGLVYEGIELVRREKLDFIVALGGGSVIDSAKAIAIGALYDGDFADFYFGKDVKNPVAPPKALPVGAIPTIAAAGSEGSCSSVVNLEPGNRKRAANGEAIRPKFAILNPEFTFTLPAYQTACGITDMLAHSIERYFSPTTDALTSDSLLEGLMYAIVKGGTRVMSHPGDYGARANIMWAGTLSHCNILGADRRQGWASHGIEHELSALYDCAHGAGLAVVMPAWMTYVKSADIPRFARWARRVWEVAEADDAKAADLGIERFRAWLRSLGMPLSFAELGADPKDIPTLVKTLNLNGNTLGVFRPLDDADVARVLELAV